MIPELDLDDYASPPEPVNCHRCHQPIQPYQKSLCIDGYYYHLPGDCEEYV